MHEIKSKTLNFIFTKYLYPCILFLVLTFFRALYKFQLNNVLNLVNQSVEIIFFNYNGLANERCRIICSVSMQSNEQNQKSIDIKYVQNGIDQNRKRKKYLFKNSNFYGN